MSIAVIDIDGVVADVRHRLHHLDGTSGRRSWPRFFAAADADPLLGEGAALAGELAARHDVVWLTGRPEWLRDVTAAWLRRHGLPGDELVMRPDTDRRPARFYKLDELARLAPREVAALVDDDPEVVTAALRAGFPAVLADWVSRGSTTARQAAVLRDAQERLGRT